MHDGMRYVLLIRKKVSLVQVELRNINDHSLSKRIIFGMIRSYGIRKYVHHRNKVELDVIIGHLLSCYWII